MFSGSLEVIGCIFDCLHCLRDSLISELKQLPLDSTLRKRYNIHDSIQNPTELNIKDYNSLQEDGFDDLSFDEFDDLSETLFKDTTNIQNALTHIDGDLTKKKSIFDYFLYLQSIIFHSFAGLKNILGQIFFGCCVFLDKNYYVHPKKSQRYQNQGYNFLPENLTWQYINLLDVLESWARGDLRERMLVLNNNNDLEDDIDELVFHFNVFIKTSNQFIDNLNQEFKKLPEDSSLRKIYLIN